MSSEIHPSNVTSWETGLQNEQNLVMGCVLTNICRRWQNNRHLTLDNTSEEIPQADIGRAGIVYRYDANNKQSLISANYGDLEFPVGRYEPTRKGFTQLTHPFVLFPELTTLTEASALNHRLRRLYSDMQSILNAYPETAIELRANQAQRIGVFIDYLLDRYRYKEGVNIQIDGATGIYVCQHKEKRKFKLSIALEHAFSAHRRNGQVGIVRHGISRIPIGECDEDYKGLLSYKEDYVTSEEAGSVFELAREANEVGRHRLEGRSLNTTYMRYI